MGILEKFRSLPRWKHADPSVRIAAVYEADDAEVLVSLARDDAEARVRRAAASRLYDTAVLGDLLRTDPDPDVRAEALRQLVGIAAETADEDVARTVARQLAEAGRVKELTIVARESAIASGTSPSTSSCSLSQTYSGTSSSSSASRSCPAS